MRAAVRSPTTRSIAVLSQPPPTVPNQQIRHFPWVPLAYRKGAGATRVQRIQQQRPTRPGHRVRGRTPPKYGAVRHQRHKRWNESRVSSRDSADHSSSSVASQEAALEAHKQSFVKLRKDLERALQNYRQLLVDTNTTDNTNNDDDKSQQKSTQKSGKKSKDGGASSTQHSNALVSQLFTAHTDVTPPQSLEDILTTEEGYQQICRLVSDMIGLTAKLQVKMLQQQQTNNNDKKKASPSSSSSNFYGSLSEQFLHGLMELQSERAQFVEAARHNHQLNSTTNASASQSMLGWLKNKVMGDDGHEARRLETNDNKDNAPIMAHEDPLYSPRLEHFQNVASAVLATLQQQDDESTTTRTEDVTNEKSPFRKIRHAQRLQQLLQKMPPSIREDESAIQSVLQAYALVGSYESARLAERVLTVESDIVMSDDLFSTMLQAYCLAARNSPRRKDRIKAVLRAEELVQQKWATTPNGNVGSGIGPEHYNYEEEKFMQCTEVLKCFSFVSSSPSKVGSGGKDKPLQISDICQRADYLVELCIGRDQLDEIFRNGSLGGLWKIAPAHYTLSLLNSLVFVYSASADASRVNLAKRLLQTLLQDSELNEDVKVPYPNVHTCKAVLNGIISIHQPKPNPSSAASHEFGMQLLDLMITRSHCWPDQSYFHSLFRLLLVSTAENPGKLAEQILSMMHVRECFGRSHGQDYSSPTMVTKKTYHYVLQAWLASAEGGDTHAAKKALELIDSMTAQSLPLLLGPSAATTSTSNDEFDRYRSVVAPDRSTYQLVLQICSAVQVPNEKDKALDIALSVHERMKEHGIHPNSYTFSLLFACCDNLLPENSKRHQEVTRELLTEARNQGNLKESFLERLEGQTAEIDFSSDEEAEEKPAAGFSLLSDLK